METTQSVPSRNVLDLNAVFWAGLLSGLSYLAVTLLLSSIYFDTPWMGIRIAASLVLGPDVIFPEQGLGIGVLLLGIMIQLVLAMVYTLLIAFIVHRGGLLAGILGGALIGLGLYAINFHNFSYFFPWIFPLRNWTLLTAHLVFGAVSGGLYELFDEDDPPAREVDR